MVAVAAAVAFVLLVAAAVGTGAGQQLDADVFSDLVRLGAAAHRMASVLRPGAPLALAGVALVLGGAACAQGRWLAAVGSALFVAACTAVSPVLRDDVIARPHHGVGGYVVNTLPSTHATVTCALGVAVLALWPWRRGPAVAIGTGVVVAAGMLASVVSWAHRPADVVASALLVAALGAGAQAAHVAVRTAVQARAARPVSGSAGRAPSASAPPRSR